MELTYFYLRTCPHCHRADRLIQELVSEDPKYAAIKFPTGWRNRRRPRWRTAMTTGMFPVSTWEGKS